MGAVEEAGPRSGAQRRKSEALGAPAGLQARASVRFSLLCSLVPPSPFSRL